jgi:hypothetical protein
MYVCMFIGRTDCQGLQLHTDRLPNSRDKVILFLMVVGKNFSRIVKNIFWWWMPITSPQYLYFDLWGCKVPNEFFFSAHWPTRIFGDVNVFLNIRHYIHLLFRVIIDSSYYWLELFLAEVLLLELLLTGVIIDQELLLPEVLLPSYYWPRYYCRGVIGPDPAE